MSEAVYNIVMPLIRIMFDWYSYTFARFRIPQKHVRKTLVPCILNRKRSNASAILHSATAITKCHGRGTNILPQLQMMIEGK